MPSGREAPRRLPGRGRDRGSPSRQVHTRPPDSRPGRGTYLTLDDPLTLSEAAGDPDGLVGGTSGLTVIDEVQRAPDLLRAIKLAVDADPTPGRFLLTGSANLLGMRSVTESLAGRAAYLDLLPLSWSEIAGRPRPSTIDEAFAAQTAEAFAGSLAPGAEVDLVIERGEQVVGLEVKSAATLTSADFSGLRALRGDLGGRFRLGVMAYLGEDVRVVDETLVGVPLATLLGVS